MSKKLNGSDFGPLPYTSHPPPNGSTLHPTPSPLPPESLRLLVVEDDSDLRTQMKWALAQDYEVLLAQDRPSALNILKNEHPPVVTLDLGLPPHPGGTEEGFLALAEMLEFNPLIKVIIITGQGEKENALKAVGQGAYDFLCKPIQTEDLKVILNRAFYLSQLEHERRDLQQRFREETFEGMLGTSSQMHKVFSSIRKVATTDVSILIVGESGTGKELVAKAIHRQSLRKESPFITINCGAIPENLLESELFGHEKGAFTGAHIQERAGSETAQGGDPFPR